MAIRGLRCRRCGEGDGDGPGKVYLYPSGNYHRGCKSEPARQQPRRTRARAAGGPKRFYENDPGYRPCKCEDYPLCGH